MTLPCVDCWSFLRPIATPQDLLWVRQSRPLGHLSVAASAFLDFRLTPLYLVSRYSDDKTPDRDVPGP